MSYIFWRSVKFVLAIFLTKCVLYNAIKFDFKTTGYPEAMQI